jgi:hypothetical protein
MTDHNQNHQPFPPPAPSDPTDQLQAELQGEGQGRGPAQGQIQAALDADLNSNGNLNLTGNENHNTNHDSSVASATSNVNVDISADLKPAGITDSNNYGSFNTIEISHTTTWQGSQDLADALNHFNNGDGSLLFMPQTVEQSFSGGSTNTAIAMDQVNSLVANNNASDISLHNSGDHLFGGDHIGNGANGGSALADVGDGATSAAAGATAQLDAFTQSIVLGANIQYNNFNTSVVGHDSSVTVSSDPMHHHS